METGAAVPYSGNPNLNASREPGHNFKVMKKFILCLLAVAAGMSAFGQGRVMGVRAGLNVTSIDLSAGSNSFSFDSRASYNVGFAYQQPLLRTLPLYRLAVSAGTGELLDGTDYDTVEVGDEVSPNADFGVRIAGDSMEPRFVHGQIVWVHRQETLRSGEIGVFLYNGAGYCKRFERAPGRVELVSLNPRYAPIRVAEGDELRVFGRVVG